MTGQCREKEALSIVRERSTMPQQSPMSDPKPPCPIDCPNRAKSEQSVKRSAWAFAFILTLFLVYRCWSDERRGEQVSPAVWLPCLLLIGTSLGVSIDKSDIASLIGIK